MTQTFAEFLQSKIEVSEKDEFGRERNRLRSVILYASRYTDLSRVPDAATLIAKSATVATVHSTIGMEAVAARGGVIIGNLPLRDRGGCWDPAAPGDVDGLEYR